MDWIWLQHLFTVTQCVGFLVASSYFPAPNQPGLDLSSSYVTLSTSALSNIHCGVLCIFHILPCLCYIYDVTTSTCYGQKDAVPTTNITSKATDVKMCNFSKEYRVCVMQKSGMLLGKTSCIYVSTKKVNGGDIMDYCQTTEFGGRLFEPRSAAISQLFDQAMQDNGYYVHDLQLWIGLYLVQGEDQHRWVSTDKFPTYTKWCQKPCSTFGAQPDGIREDQYCVASVYRDEKGTFEWWDWKCRQSYQVVCEITPIV